jgi:hypothetical protein
VFRSFSKFSSSKKHPSRLSISIPFPHPHRCEQLAAKPDTTLSPETSVNHTRTRPTNPLFNQSEASFLSTKGKYRSNKLRYRPEQTEDKMPELRQRQPKTSTPTSTCKPRGQKEIVKGKIHPDQEEGHTSAMDRGADDPRDPLLGPQAAKQDAADSALPQRHSSTSPPSLLVAHEQDSGAENMENLSRKSQWIVLALASGACAAFNGVFAKL